jgi:hypothetical protein
MTIPPLSIRYEDAYTVGLARKHPDDVFVFGDNLVARGKAKGAGQSVIRDEPNAFGIPTKRLPSVAAAAYFSDQDDEIEAMVGALRELYRLGRTKTLVFPAGGIGTGRAKMSSKSPRAWAMLNDILLTHFGVDNAHAVRVSEGPNRP